MKVYIVKYALTKGIIAIELVDNLGICENMLYAKVGSYSQYFHKGEWAENKEEALSLAEKKRQNAIKSAHKKLNKLSTMVFEIREIKDTLKK